MVEIIQQFWSEFQGFQFSNEVLILLGGLLVLIGVIKIVRSSLKMFFWVFLSGVGAASVAYGMNNAGLDIPNADGIEISDLIGQGKELSLDVRKVLCSRWLDGEEE